MDIGSVAPPVEPSELPAVISRLRSLGGHSLSLASPPERLHGGFWAEMWILHLQDHTSGLPGDVVLRLAPDSRLAAHETAVQRAVADQGFPTPHILASEPATDDCRFWSVMELAVGTPLLGGLSGVSALTNLPRLARTLPVQLASIAAQLHALDTTPSREALAEIGGERIGVEGLLDHYEATALAIGDRILADAVTALRATAVPATRPVVCHGDLHPFNVLNDQGNLTLLDWTASRIADPAYDIAFTMLLLENPPLEAPALLRRPLERATGWLARRFRTAYTAAAGAPVDERQFEWYTRLQMLRVSIDVAEWRDNNELQSRSGHPWLALDQRFRARLGQVQTKRQR